VGERAGVVLRIGWRVLGDAARPPRPGAVLLEALGRARRPAGGVHERQQELDVPPLGLGDEQVEPPQEPLLVAVRSVLLQRGPADVDPRHARAAVLHEIELPAHLGLVDVAPQQVRVDAGDLAGGGGGGGGEDGRDGHGEEEQGARECAAAERQGVLPE
jgi:hypothetical protein